MSATDDRTPKPTPMLDLLSEERVLTVLMGPTPETFRVREQCDCFHEVTLTDDQLRRLAAELVAIADGRSAPQEDR